MSINNRQQFISTFILALILASFLTTMSTTQAEENNSETVTFKRPTVNPREGSPTGIDKGAGSHGGYCNLDKKQHPDVSPLMALVPSEKVIDNSTTYVWGKTTSEHPTLWFYIAYAANTQVELEIQNEAEEPIYQASFIVKNTPGLISFTLPNNSPKLAPNQKYLWYLYIKCQSQGSPDDVISGWIERVELNPLDAQLTQLDLIDFYSKNGIWYDAITNLNQLRDNDSQNKQYTQIWHDLLQQVGMEELSQIPVVETF